MDNLLVVDSVSKTFAEHKALNSVSINIPKGSIFGLLGPNGAGKTTLIRIINQITMPDSGSVFLDNEPLKQSHIKDIGYLPEERGLYPKMKVGEQALYLAQLKGMTKSDAKKQLKHWFEKFDIGEWWGKKVVELSNAAGIVMGISGLRAKLRNLAIASNNSLINKYTRDIWENYF